MWGYEEKREAKRRRDHLNDEGGNGILQKINYFKINEILS